ncbi:MAG: hypothetical protein RL277_2999 [Planctomycetota bacterium]|jgi:ABC-2 type transport system ATP-binding protein
MIRVEGVHKSYAGTHAVAGVSFTIQPGEIVGFLGPNGAGKSTLLRMLSTYLEPDAGRIEIAGIDTVRDPLGARARLGYLPEHNPLFEGMRVRECLEFLAHMRGLNREEREQRLGLAAEQLGLAAVLQKRVRECSKGYRQRIGLAGALLGDPAVLLLDEPTHGLDPLQVLALREFLHGISPGRAILFSSHILAEVAAISSRVLLLHQGRLLLDEPTATLEQRARAEGINLEQHIVRVIERAGGSTRLG